MQPLRSATWTWGLMGAGFGVCFPVFAAAIRWWQGGLDNVVTAFSGDPLLWIILSAPLFLGGMAALGGVQQDRLAAMGARFEAEVAVRTGRVVSTIRENTTALTARAGEFGQHSVTVASGVDRATRETQAASESANQVSMAVQSVAVGVEQLGASMRQVASSARRAAEVANDAVDAADRTRDTVAHLGEASDEIGQVVQTITRLAQQTQRLALNARIEAARAGDAGLGFAVVAREVKQLADRSAAAAGEVSERVSAIRTRTAATTEAIGGIGAIVVEISHLQGSIAVAVSEQTAVVSSASATLSEAAEGTSRVADNLASVVTNVDAAARGIASVAEAAGTLGALVGSLGAAAESLGPSGRAAGAGERRLRHDRA